MEERQAFAMRQTKITTFAVENESTFPASNGDEARGNDNPTYRDVIHEIEASSGRREPRTHRRVRHRRHRHHEINKNLVPCDWFSCRNLGDGYQSPSIENDKLQLPEDARVRLRAVGTSKFNEDVERARGELNSDLQRAVNSQFVNAKVPSWTESMVADQVPRMLFDQVAKTSKGPRGQAAERRLPRVPTLSLRKHVIPQRRVADPHNPSETPCQNGQMCVFAKLLPDYAQPMKSFNVPGVLESPYCILCIWKQTSHLVTVAQNEWNNIKHVSEIGLLQNHSVHVNIPGEYRSKYCYDVGTQPNGLVGPVPIFDAKHFDLEAEYTITAADGVEWRTVMEKPEVFF